MNLKSLTEEDIWS